MIARAGAALRFTSVATSSTKATDDRASASMRKFAHPQRGKYCRMRYFPAGPPESATPASRRVNRQWLARRRLCSWRRACSSSVCCVSLSAFLSSSAAPDAAAACSVSWRMLSRKMAMRSAISVRESEVESVKVILPCLARSHSALPDFRRVN